MAPARRRRSQVPIPLVALLVLVAGAGLVGILYGAGKLEGTPLGGAVDRLLGREVQAAENPNLVRVPVTARALPAGHRLVLADLIDAAKGKPYTAPVDRTSAGFNADWILRPERLEGRVLRRPKRANKAYTDADFLPPGAPEGPAGLCRGGHRWLVATTDRVEGLEELGFGAHFDLFSLAPVDEAVRDEVRQVLQQAGALLAPSERMQLQKALERSDQVRVVSDAMVLQPAEYDTEAKPGQPRKVAFDVRPEQLAALQAELSAGRRLYASARPSDGGDVPLPRSVTDEIAPILDRFQWVTVYEGNQVRKLLVLPEEQPRSAPQGGPSAASPGGHEGR